MIRASAILELKSADDGDRLIEGLATTPTPDRGGDSMDPLGASFTLPLPLLWQHDQTQPIGEVIEARATPAGIWIKARLAAISDPGPLKARLDDAYQSLKARLVRGLSIGYQPLEVRPIKGGPGRQIRRWLLAEVSAVTLPQNLEARILSVKHDATRTPMQTTAERITALENSRAAKVAQLAGLMQKAQDDGVTLAGGPDAEDYDGIEVEVKNIDADLGRLRSLEQLNKAAAQPVAPTPGPRPYTAVTIKPNLPLGTSFVRAACATLVCNGNRHEAAQYAQDRWGDSTPEVALYLKAAVAPGNTTDATWASPLVNQSIAADFLELLRPATIVGRIGGLRQVPFNTKVPSQTAGGTYGWVGEAKPKPVTKLAFSAETLGVNKVAGIIVLTEELVRLSSPKAEELVRADMIAGIARFIDTQFIDPAVAAVAGVNPASITNGAPTAAATTNALADIMGLINHFATNNIAVDGVTFILSPANALALSFATYTDGSPKFPGVDVNGGSYKGLQFVTSNTAGTNVIALQPSLVLYADDGGVTIDASREASLQMDSAPASPADATTVYVSLWQTNSVGLRAERFITWKRANTNAVKYLTAAAYPAPAAEDAHAAAAKK